MSNDNTKKPPIDTVYLLGAGFSYNALPVVNDWPAAMKNFKIILIKYLKSNKEENVNNLILRIVLEKSLKFQTPDTFAKILKITKDENLKYLKFLIDLFISSCHCSKLILQDNRPHTSFKTFGDFLQQQRVYNKENLNQYSVDGWVLDSRIISFASEIHDQFSRFSFLNWNYDLQLEKSLNLVTDRKDLTDMSSENIYHINGKIDVKKISQIIKNYNQTPIEPPFKNCFINIESKIRYAFEQPLSSAPLQETQISALEQSKNLVIIGYSFPYYNNEVDSFILKHFIGDQIKAEKGKKKKIYIQDQVPLVIEERLSLYHEEIFNTLSKDKRIIPIKDTTRFFVPPAS